MLNLERRMRIRQLRREKIGIKGRKWEVFPGRRNSMCKCEDMGGSSSSTRQHVSGTSQCTSPKHPVSCIEPGLVIHFIYDIIQVSMPFSQIIPPSPSPTESKRLFYTSVSLLLSLIQGYRCRLSKFHIYALVYCIGVFLSGLLHSVK